MKNILIFRPTYHPEISGGTHLTDDLIKEMILHGYKITVICPTPIRVSNELRRIYRKRTKEVLENGNLTIYRVNCFFGEKNKIMRAMRMFILSRKMCVLAKRIAGFDLFFSHTMPVFLGIFSIKLKNTLKIPMVYIQSDVYSQAVKSARLFKSDKLTHLISKILESHEKKAMLASTKIITVSSIFYYNNIRQGIDPDKMELIYNWVDTISVTYVNRESNYLFDKYRLSRDKFYVTYAGNIGIAQNIVILAKAAERLIYNTNIRFVIFGDGIRKNQIEEYIKKKDITNMIILPLQSLDEVKYVYSVGNVGVILGIKGTSLNGFPSKFVTMLSASQPVLASFDRESDLSRIVLENNCGIVIEPDSIDELVHGIENMYNDQSVLNEYSNNSRKCAIQLFNKQVSVNKYIKVVNEIEEQL